MITATSASVIAFASGMGLPVSTTYVAFAAVLGTGLSDRVFARGDADKKLGRAIWVIVCWFIAPVIAVVATGCVSMVVYKLSTVGLIASIVANFLIRRSFKRRADQHEKQYHTSTHTADTTAEAPEPETQEPADQPPPPEPNAPASDD